MRGSCWRPRPSPSCSSQNRFFACTPGAVVVWQWCGGGVAVVVWWWGGGVVLVWRWCGGRLNVEFPPHRTTTPVRSRVRGASPGMAYRLVGIGRGAAAPSPPTSTPCMLSPFTASLMRRTSFPGTAHGFEKCFRNALH
eukprot:gene14324-biopygen14173